MILFSAKVRRGSGGKNQFVSQKGKLVRRSFCLPVYFKAIENLFVNIILVLLGFALAFMNGVQECRGVDAEEMLGEEFGRRRRGTAFFKRRCEDVFSKLKIRSRSRCG
jgi:hypothetical protein